MKEKTLRFLRQLRFEAINRPGLVAGVGFALMFIPGQVAAQEGFSELETTLTEALNSVGPILLAAIISGLTLLFVYHRGRSRVGDPTSRGQAKSDSNGDLITIAVIIGVLLFVIPGIFGILGYSPDFGGGNGVAGLFGIGDG